jgi:hypothetical protein
MQDISSLARLVSGLRGAISLEALVQKYMPGYVCIQRRLGLQDFHVSFFFNCVTNKQALSKQDDIRQSAWGAETLTQDQKEYAAADACASMLVYVALKRTQSAQRATSATPSSQDLSARYGNYGYEELRADSEPQLALALSEYPDYQHGVHIVGNNSNGHCAVVSLLQLRDNVSDMPAPAAVRDLRNSIREQACMVC